MTEPIQDNSAVPHSTAALSSEILEVEVSVRGATFTSRGAPSQVLQAFEAFREFFASPEGVVPREDVLSGMTAAHVS